MSDRFLCIKLANGHILPTDEAGREIIKAIPPGEEFYVKVSRARNPAFHRKFMALLRFGFENWSPDEGVKNFDQFREQVMILAGHYTLVAMIGGGLKMRAKSVSFASMDETEFRRVYQDCFEVLYKYIFEKTYKTRAELEKVLLQLTSFDYV